MDLVVTQNGAETRLFHNTGAKPGLRGRLAGPPANPTGVGAVIRLVFGDRLGPAREIHAGSGYWSCDSPVQVMAFADRRTQVQVRWPGGKVTASPVSANDREIRIDSEGRAQTTR